MTLLTLSRQTFSRTFYDGQSSLGILIDSNNQNTIFNENILIYSLRKLLGKNRHTIIVMLNSYSEVISSNTKNNTTKLFVDWTNQTYIVRAAI
jgi:hypothetical protein